MTDAETPLPRLTSLDPRPGPWSADDLHERPCPICGAAGEARFVRPDGLQVRACPCGTWFVSPAPGPDQLEAFYRGYHRRHRVEAFRGTEHRDRSRLPSFEDPAALVERIRARDPNEDLRVRELASTLALDGARALDIGCGTGQLLYLLSAMGAEVTGLEVDPEAVEFVSTQLGLPCIRGTLDSSGLDADGYDLVVLQDLIEHVLDPRALLTRAAAHLRPGGVLYLWTPNATYAEGDPAPRVFRADFEHLQFLSTRTVVQLALELDLEVLHLESVGHLRTAEAGPRRPTLRSLAARLPGLETIARARAALHNRYADRSGNYHLLALLRYGVAHPPQESQSKVPQ